MHLNDPERRQPATGNDPDNLASICGPNVRLAGQVIEVANADFRIEILPAGLHVEMRIALLCPDGGSAGTVTLQGLLPETSLELCTCLLQPKSGVFEPLQHFEEALHSALQDGVRISSDFANGIHNILSGYCDRYVRDLDEKAFAAVINVEAVSDRILHLNLPTHYLLNSIFLRFQEHYESPQYRGKTFTLDEFKAWYPTSRPHGQFSYYSDWAGFNIPSYVLTAFEAGQFDPLSSGEKALLSSLPKSSDKFYIIGTCGEVNDVVLRHEIAHGLYYTDCTYRSEVDGVLSGLNLKPVQDYLAALGYHPASFQDECHAYLGDPLEELEDAGIDISPFRAAHAQLLEIYQRHRLTH